MSPPELNVASELNVAFNKSFDTNGSSYQTSCHLEESKLVKKLSPATVVIFWRECFGYCSMHRRMEIVQKKEINLLISLFKIHEI